MAYMTGIYVPFDKKLSMQWSDRPQEEYWLLLFNIACRGHEKGRQSQRPHIQRGLVCYSQRYEPK